MIKTQYCEEDYAIYIALLINEVESDHCCSVVRRITQAVQGKVEREREREKGENIVENRELCAKRQGEISTFIFEREKSRIQIRIREAQTIRRDHQFLVFHIHGSDK